MWQNVIHDAICTVMRRVDAPYLNSDITKRIVSCALDVHRALGPGLLESTYRACLVHELEMAGLQARCEVPIPITYREISIDTSYRADVIVEDCVLLELKSAERLLPIHEAQILTYLKLCRIRVGLLVNFNVTRLKLGLRRFVR
jgi:GxxExxY protein